MEMFMREIGKKTRPMDLAFFTLNLEKFTKETGKMTFKMAKEKKCGRMDQNTKETIKWAKNKEREIFYFPTEIDTSESSKTTKLTDTENTTIWVVVYIKESGGTI